MKKILTFILVLASTNSYCQLEKIYNRPEYSINYPQKWTMDTSKRVAAAIFFYSPSENPKDDFSENVNILTQDLAGQNIDLASYKAITEKQILTMAVNGKLIKSALEKTIKGDRYCVEYQMTMNNNDLHIKSLCYIKKDIAYLATFTTKTDTFDKYNKTGTEILESFRLN